MTCRLVTSQSPAVIIPWPGPAVRNTHAALQRALDAYNRAKSPALWEEVQIALKAYTKACEIEGVDP